MTGLKSPKSLAYMIQSFLKQGNNSGAIQFFKAEKERFSPKELKIVQWELREDVKLNLDGMHDGVDGTFVVYKLKFEEHLINNNLEKIFDIFEDIMRAEYIPTIHMYEEAIKRLVADPKFAPAALHLYQEMEECGMAMNLDLPALVEHTPESEFKIYYQKVILPLILNKGSTLPLNWLARETRQRGPIDRQIFNCLLKVIGKKEDTDKALELVANAEKYITEPDIGTYNAFLYRSFTASGKGNKKPLEHAGKVLEWMNQRNISPNLTTYSYLIEIYFANDHFNEAIAAFDQSPLLKTFNEDRVMDLGDQIMVDCHGLTSGVASLILYKLLSLHPNKTIMVLAELEDYSLQRREGEFTLKTAESAFPLIDETISVERIAGEFEQFIIRRVAKTSKVL